MKSALEHVTEKPIAVGLILASLIVIYVARGFPDNGQVGPSFFPIFLSVGIIAFSLLVIATEEGGGLDTDLESVKPALVVFLMLVGYLLALPITGFLLGTFLFVLILLPYSGVRSKLVITGYSLGVPLVLYYIFDVIFLVRLPVGVVPISRLLPNIPLVVM